MDYERHRENQLIHRTCDEARSHNGIVRSQDINEMLPIMDFWTAKGYNFVAKASVAQW